MKLRLESDKSLALPGILAMYEDWLRVRTPHPKDVMVSASMARNMVMRVITSKNVGKKDISQILRPRQKQSDASR